MHTAMLAVREAGPHERYMCAAFRFAAGILGQGSLSELQKYLFIQSVCSVSLIYDLSYHA